MKEDEGSAPMKSFFHDPPDYFRWSIGLATIISLVGAVVYYCGVEFGDTTIYAAAAIETALYIYFLLDVARSGRVHEEKRVVWLVAMLFVQILAAPLYWYFYLKPERA